MLTFERISHLNKGLPANIYFESDERITLNKEDKICTKKDESGENLLYVATTSHPDVLTYGAIQLEDNYRAKAGYTWSSRTGVMNKEFNETLVEVIINSACYAMRVEDLKKYLPEGYKIVDMMLFDNEPYYDVVSDNEEC